MRTSSASAPTTTPRSRRGRAPGRRWSFGGFLLIGPEPGIPYRASRRIAVRRLRSRASGGRRRTQMRSCGEGQREGIAVFAAWGIVGGPFPVAGAGRDARRGHRRRRLGNGRVRAAVRGRLQRSRQRIDPGGGGGPDSARRARRRRGGDLHPVTGTVDDAVLASASRTGWPRSPARSEPAGRRTGRTTPRSTCRGQGPARSRC